MTMIKKISIYLILSYQSTVEHLITNHHEARSYLAVIQKSQIIRGAREYPFPESKKLNCFTTLII